MSRGALYLGFFALALQVAAASAQEKIEGKVVGTKLTHCDMEELTFNVPLGPPITRGGKTEYLPALRGKTVVLTHVTEKNERVAKAIEAAK